MKTSASKRRRSRWLGAVGVGGLLALVLLLAFAWRRLSPVGPSPVATANATNGAGKVGFELASVLEPSRELDEARRRLDRDSSSAVPLLEGLRRFLGTLPAGAASAAIREFLESGADAPTRLEFKLQADGFLAGAPSLRVFLLDYLAQVDPAGAGEYGRGILARMESADECAVALRDVARSEPGGAGRAFVEEQFGRMLQRADWQQAPSTGFLEAFDAAVWVGGTNLIGPLGELLRQKERRAVAHAAFLALDRLSIQSPGTTLAALQANPDLLAGREATRAGYFARADVREAHQREILERYLLDPELAPAELEQFAGLYPNASYLVSPNLLTRTPTPDHATLVMGDRAALRTLREWLDDPRFAAVRTQLERAERRLEGFVSSAGFK